MTCSVLITDKKEKNKEKKKKKSANAWRNLDLEEYLVRKYCEPKAYWHCLHELEPLGVGRYYSFDELNNPRYWLKTVAKYTQQEPSAAAKHACQSLFHCRGSQASRCDLERG